MAGELQATASSRAEGPPLAPGLDSEEEHGRQSQHQQSQKTCES